jgi:hypothetical protein
MLTPGSEAGWSGFAAVSILAQPQAPTLQIESDFRALTARETAPALRADAADRLLSIARDPLLAQRLIDILRSEAEPQEPRLALLAALSRSWFPPPRLFQTISHLATGPTTAPPPLVMSALAAYRTPDAVLMLIRSLGLRSPEPIRAAAAEALTSITGRDDLGSDRLAWNDWWKRHGTLDTARWRETLAEGVWRRDQRLNAERAGLGAKLTEMSRRLYLAMPADGPERPRLLVQLLGETTPELRSLGLDLVAREISAGRPVDPLVVDAVALLLESPDPAARARAAVLASQLIPPDIETRIAAALSRETNYAAASNLLIAAARWPTPAIAESALAWLERAGGDMPAAIEALLALHAAGGFTSADHHARAARVLRNIDLAAVFPAGYRLLADIGLDQDRQHIASLLDSPTPAVRAAAADALADHAPFCNPILDAAHADPRLFPIAVRAIIASRPTADGYAALAALPAESEEVRRDGLILAGLELPLPELLRAATDFTSDPELREDLLERLTKHTVAVRPEPGATPLLRAQAIALLAETRLTLGRPDRALAALDNLPEPLPEDANPARITRLTTVSLLWTNQVDRAADLGSPPDYWLDALELAIQEDHAPELLEEIRRRFEPVLTEDQRLRLHGIAARLELIDRPRVQR